MTKQRQSSAQGNETQLSLVQGETLATLGTGLDEMMRHVHSLRSPVVKMLMLVINNLVQIGGKQIPQKPQNPGDAIQPMETDTSNGGASTAMDGPSASVSGEL